MFSTHPSELISCGCRPENLPFLPVPELPDSTGSSDLLEAVSKFIGIEVQYDVYICTLCIVVHLLGSLCVR